METEAMTASELLVSKGLTWKVGAVPIFDDEGRELEAFKAIQRIDTGQTFQVAKAGYRPIQNSEALSLLDEAVGTGMAKYEDADTYKDGAIVFVRAKVPMDYAIKGDEITTYLYVATSHDSSGSCRIFGHSQRMICQNLLRTITAAKFSFRHTSNYKLRLDQCKEVFASYREAFQAEKEAYQRMAKTPMQQLELDSFLHELLNVQDIEDASTRSINIMNEIKHKTEYGIGLDKHKGTQWAAYNAVTEYVTHARSSKGAQREYSALLGSGQNMTEKAYALLTR